ncbi:hypothetical protein D3C85_1682220 [compost metagenome]
MTELIRIKEMLGGPVDGHEAFWRDPVLPVEEVQYALPTGATRKARYRLVKGAVRGEPFLAYVDNDLGRKEALCLIAEKLIQIDSLG